jgi:hypothetical protein
VNNAASTAVNWTASGGSVSSTGTYTAPTQPGFYTVTATSATDGTKQGTAFITVVAPGAAPNQLGTVTQVTPVTCSPSTVNPPVNGDQCMNLTVQCPGVADYSSVELKVTNATSPIGTAIYTTGGGGNAFYEDQFVFGNTAINKAVSGGITVVQTNFNSTVGWLDGPGGVMLNSCRWATTAKWVHDNIAAGTAFCATGNSGGGGVIAYALSRYGESNIFNYVQPTSGPPFSSITDGCTCQHVTQQSNCGAVLDTCYGGDANMFLDPAYQNTNCSSHNTVDQPTWDADSIISSDLKSTLNYGTTSVHFIFGGLDTGSGAANAVIWENQIASQHDAQCVASAPHQIADDTAGADAVADNLITNCH